MLANDVFTARSSQLLVGILVGLVLGWFAHSAARGTNVYTLYRNSVLDSSARIHVATFDTNDGNPTFNSGNCQEAGKLFQQQPGYARYWCEKGVYKP